MEDPIEIEISNLVVILKRAAFSTNHDIGTSTNILPKTLMAALTLETASVSNLAKKLAKLCNASLVQWFSD